MLIDLWFKGVVQCGHLEYLKDKFNGAEDLYKIYYEKIIFINADYFNRSFKKNNNNSV